MTLRFYPGGPWAVKGTLCWEDSYGVNGCYVVRCAGVEIPRDTYKAADGNVSQGRWLLAPSVGYNYTALLPIEE